jgi:hypothetical protein
MKLKDFTIGGNLLENASFVICCEDNEWEDVVDMNYILDNYKKYSDYSIRAINIKNNKAIIKLVK